MVLRRNVLAAGISTGAVGISGCIDSVSSRVGGSPARELSVINIDDAREEYGIALDAEISPAQPADDALPKLHLKIENTGEQLVIFDTWHRYRAGEFDYSDPEGLVTITTWEANDLELDSEGCWSHEGDFPRTTALRDAFLEQGETESDDRYVIQLDRHIDDGCLETGEYSFTSTYYVHDVETEDEFHESGADLDAGESIECSFTINLTE